MLTATTTSSSEELKQILQLQQRNLRASLSKEEMMSQGFVTIHHSPEVLQLMHQLAPSIIIKEDEQVVGYALTMLPECRSLVPGLVPMFEKFDELEWNDRALNEYDYYVMGQICIDKKFRGQGLFDLLYEKHKETYQSKFDFIITEVSTGNLRSLAAHERVGFKTVQTYRDEQDEWAVVIWDWS